MLGRKSWMTVLVALLLLAGTTAVEAQWVMVGRAAVNRVRRMTQQSSSGGYDVATVFLAAPADRVYAGALKALQARPGITVTEQDSRAGKLKFRKGNLVAGLQVSPVSDTVTQLVIASSVGDGTQPSTTSLVLDGVLRVCEEMKVECSVSQE